MPRLHPFVDEPPQHGARGAREHYFDAGIDARSPAGPGALLVGGSLPQGALPRDALFGGPQLSAVPRGTHRGPECRTDARNFHAQDIAGR